MCSRLCSVTGRIVFSVLGIVAGLLAAVLFACQYRNFNATAWGLISSALATATLVLHLKWRNESLVVHRSRLTTVMLFGCVGQLAGACAMSTYVAVALLQGQGLQPMYGENYWVALVWAFMTWKWAFQLFWFARKYRREYEAQSLFKTIDGTYSGPEYT